MINTIPKRPARRQAHELRCCAGGGEFGDVPPCHRAQFRSRRGRVGVGEAARTVVEWRGDSALGAGRCRAPRAVARGRRGGAGGVYTMFVTLYRNKNARGIYAHLTLCLLSSSSTLMSYLVHTNRSSFGRRPATSASSRSPCRTPKMTTIQLSAFPSQICPLPAAPAALLSWPPTIAGCQRSTR